MNFTNNSVEPHQLPAIEQVNYQSLEKEYLNLLRIVFIISGLIVLLISTALFYFIKKIQVPVIIYSSISVFVLLSVLGWISASLDYKHSGYALREKDILFRRGWFIQKIRAVPLKRIQHVSIQSGPLERKFGLASISIYTAGSESADFTLIGISKKKAQQIKEWISTQLNGEFN